MTQKEKFDPKWDKSKETYEQYMARVQAHIKANKSTDWDEVERYAAKFVKDVRRDKGAESDAAIMKEVDPGRGFIKKKKKKKKKID